MNTFEKIDADFTNVTNTIADWPATGAALTQGAVASLSQCQAETAQLVSRRLRAWLELPGELSGCRNIPEVTHVQVDFWRHFWTDWLGTGQRMTAVWADVLRPSGGDAAASRRESPPERPSKLETNPMSNWQWWRTDMKGIVPRRGEQGGPAAGRNGAH